VVRSQSHSIRIYCIAYTTKYDPVLENPGVPIPNCMPSGDLFYGDKPLIRDYIGPRCQAIGVEPVYDVAGALLPLLLTIAGDAPKITFPLEDFGGWQRAWQ
jgi:hypothetical protein